jgi:hypothetical protein
VKTWLVALVMKSDIETFFCMTENVMLMEGSNLGRR